jgi:hypothetical protein
MAARRMTDQQWNPWKLATIGLLMMGATALLTGVVVAHYAGSDTSGPAPAGVQAPPGTASGPADQPAAQPALQPAPIAAPGQVPPTPAVRDQMAAVAPPVPPVAEAHAPSRPRSSDISACNRYASAVGRHQPTQTLTDALLGGALGAGLGAAGGAIAGGAAGKGAGIGGLVGAAAGTLYGLNDANRTNARAADAYRACMRSRGYGG